MRTNRIPKKFEKLVPAELTLEKNEWVDDCPYNSLHYCASKKRDLHVTKCRNAYIAARNSDDQDIEMFACKYNDLHHVPYIELRWHQERCPFRQEGFFHGGDAQIPMNPKVGLERKTLETMNGVELDSVALEFPEKFSRGEEDWDAEETLFETNKRPFDPIFKLHEQGDLPWPPGRLSKGERRAFRQAGKSPVRKTYEGSHFPQYLQLSQH